MSDFKPVAETDEDKLNLARHMAGVYTRNVYLTGNIDKNHAPITPTDFAKLYIDCFQQIYDVMTKN